MVSTRSALKSPTSATSPTATAAKRAAPADAAKSPVAKKQASSPKKNATSDFVVGARVTKDATLVNQDGVDVKFADTFKDRGVVFFMYPKANTPGCTKQACGFRDHIQEIKDAGFDVYGLSADSPKALLSWKTKEQLSYDLLSDPTHELIQYFGSSIGGSKVQRSHVVILKGGVVGDIQGKVSPAESVERGVAFVTAHKQQQSGSDSTPAAAPATQAAVAVSPVLAAALTAEVPVVAPASAAAVDSTSEDAAARKAFAVGDTVSLELELLNHASERVAVQSLFTDRGAIFFTYPKADTPGCTIQACGFNDHLQEIQDAGFDVYGLGADSPAELLAWKTKQSYRYSFLSDPTHALIARFGSSADAGARVERSHVIVLPGGKVGQVELQVAPADSFTKALAFAKAYAAAK